MEGQGQQVVVSSRSLRVQVVTRTDTGLVRGNNEDTIVLGDLTTGAPSFSGRLGPKGLIFGVCDGMGGEAAGEIASRITADSVLRFMALTQFDQNRDDFARALVTAVELAGQAVKAFAARHPKCEKMGTTCTVGALRETHLVLGHVGDSRAYLLRAGRFEQLTQDQNLANEMLQRGQITREQVPEVVHGKHITQAVGNTDALRVDIEHLDLTRGDRVLICSDGLSDMVNDRAIAEVLAGPLDLQAQADELVARAKRAGGRDNISLVLVHVVGVGHGMGEEVTAHSYPWGLSAAAASQAQTVIQSRSPVSRRPRMAALAGVALALCAAWWWRGRAALTEAYSEPERAARTPEELRQVPPPPELPDLPHKPGQELPEQAPEMGLAPPASREAPLRQPTQKARLAPPDRKPSRRPSAGASKPDVEVVISPPNPMLRNPFID